MEASSYDYLVKILLIGDSGVGKTCMFQKFDNDEFTLNHMPTIAIDFSIKTIVVAGKRIKVQVWDTAGQERYNTLTVGFFKSAHCILLCFSLADRASFAAVDRWMHQIRTFSPKEVLVVLVGNKSDLVQERKVAAEEATELARAFGVDYFETSAATGENIAKIFMTVGEKLLVILENAAGAEDGRALADASDFKSSCCK